MTIKINITQTETGYNFINMSRWDTPLVATIRDGHNKPGIYLWRILDEDKSGFHNLDGAISVVKMHLTQIAADRLGCNVEFIDR